MLEVGLIARLTTTSWPDEMPPSVPPAWFDRKPVRRQFVAVLRSTLLDRGEAVADLDALDGIDAHHRVRRGRRRAGRTPARRGPGARRVATTVTRAPIESPSRRSRSISASSSGDPRRVRAEERVAIDLAPGRAGSMRDVAHLRQVAAISAPRGARRGTCGRSRRPPRASPSRAPTSVRRRGSRASRTSAGRCSRHGPGRKRSLILS